MPHEPRPESRSARQLIESASAFARREMLAEAQQALQDARAALALRSDVGPAHWCDACLVALEIAARGGDVPEMEAEAAQLRSLSRGGRYWTKQARGRVGGCAGRIDLAHMDRVFAILAGEAIPAAPHREPPAVPERAHEAAADHPTPLREPLMDPLSAEGPPTSHAPVNEEAVAGWKARLSEAADDLHSIRVEDRRHAAGFVEAPVASSSIVPLVVPEVEPSGLPFPDPLPPPHAGRYGMLALPLGAAPRSHAASRYRLIPRRMGPAAGGILVVLGLAAATCIYFSRAALRISFAPPGNVAAEQALRHGGAPHALGFASMRGIDPESAPRNHLARGQALLASGDTAGAVAALSAAAQSDSRGTIAWTAAETLVRLPGRSAPAAEAYLLAFAAGLPADRAQIVAHAQELAGRPDRAQRVREQAALGLRR